MIKNPKLAENIARKLLKLKAVQISRQPFTWASGRISPIYCDNRTLLSHVIERNIIIEALEEVIKDHMHCIDAIAGVATAGIPWGAIIADHFQTPFCYVRSKPKEHGTGSQIEGDVPLGSKLAVIEDLFSTGKSVLEAVEALRNAQFSPRLIISVFTYGFAETEEVFEKAGVKHFSLCDYQTLLRVALEEGHIEESDRTLLGSWDKDPKGWSDRITNSLIHQS